MADLSLLEDNANHQAENDSCFHLHVAVWWDTNVCPSLPRYFRPFALPSRHSLYESVIPRLAIAVANHADAALKDIYRRTSCELKTPPGELRHQGHTKA